MKFAQDSLNTLMMPYCEVHRIGQENLNTLMMTYCEGDRRLLLVFISFIAGLAQWLTPSM